MIGKVESKHGTITLEDDGSISCDNPRMKKTAETLLIPYREEHSPALGPFGDKFLNDLAKMLDGKVTIEEREDPPAEAIY